MVKMRYVEKVWSLLFTDSIASLDSLRDNFFNFLPFNSGTFITIPSAKSLFVLNSLYDRRR